MKMPTNNMTKVFATLAVVLFIGLGASNGGGVRPPRSRDKDIVRRLTRNPLVDERIPRRRPIRYASNRVLVRFQAAVTEDYAEGLLRSYGFPSFRRIPAVGLYSVQTVTGVSVVETLAMLRRNGDIEVARPDYRTRLTALPNDTYFRTFQYNLRNLGTLINLGGGLTFQTTSGADIKALKAWDESTGDPGVVIAIIDTGVDMTHAELAAKVVSTGHDFANNDDDATDDNAHGTHVAGIAAADTNNSEGIAGVAWNCKILPVKVTDADGNGYYSWMIDAIIWATDHGADVINLSMGGDVDDPFLEDACKYAYDHGVVIAASAGNDGGPVLYPAAYNSYVLAVAASDYDDMVPEWSNFGPEIDVAAPGVYIMAPIPQWYAGEGNPPYGFASGTSMAAPHVSGMAALIRSLKPELGVAEIMNIIRYTADDISVSVDDGPNPHAGYGRINMERALSPYILK
jgi:thermitase